jgi:hypothetical protein
VRFGLSPLGFTERAGVSAPLAADLQTEAHHTQAMVTRSHARIEFDDGKKGATISTPGSNKIVISGDGQCILLHDQNDNQVELGASGFALSTDTGRV